MEEIISVLKSCIASKKGGVLFVDIDGEYRELVGESIPFQKFGFNSLGRFIKSVPDLQFESTENGTVLRVVDNKVAHLTKLIENQKSSHPKWKRMGKENMRSSQNLSKIYRSKYSFKSSRAPERVNHWFSSRPYQAYSKENYLYTMRDRLDGREEQYANNRLTKMVGDVLTVTVDNRFNQDVCDKSVQFIDDTNLNNSSTY